MGEVINFPPRQLTAQDDVDWLLTAYGLLDAGLAAAGPETRSGACRLLVNNLIGRLAAEIGCSAAADYLATKSVQLRTNKPHAPRPA